MACRNAPAATLESKPSHCPGLLVQLTRPLARAEAPVIHTRTCQPLPIRAEFHGGHGFRVASQGEFQSVVWFNRGRLLKRQHQSPKALCWFQAQTHLLSSKSTFQVPSRPSGSHLSNWTGFNLGYFPPQPCFSCRPLLRAPAAPGQLNTEASQGPTPPPMRPEAPCDVAATPLKGPSVLPGVHRRGWHTCMGPRSVEPGRGLHERLSGTAENLTISTRDLCCG